MLSEYEKKRLENIESNKQILRELGLERPPVFSPTESYMKKTNKAKPNKRRTINTNGNKDKRVKSTSSDDSLSRGEEEYLVRRSSRLAKLPAKNFEEIEEVVERKRGSYISKKDLDWRKDRPNPKRFGEIPGVEVGAWWATRMECSHQGVHAPPVAGISFDESKGAYSVALSGGYEDDVDWGEAFTYTGSGGRDLKGTKNNPKNLRTGPQTKDQILTAGNLALKISCETNNPVRVIRGYKLDNEFAPKEGYRYDGLYTVEKWWEETGLAGFKVFKYAFKRMEGQLPLGTCEKSWSDSEEEDDDDCNEENEE